MPSRGKEILSSEQREEYLKIPQLYPYIRSGDFQDILQFERHQTKCNYYLFLKMFLYPIILHFLLVSPRYYFYMM